MKNLFYILNWVILSSFFACSKSELPEFNKISSPRIIALITDKPEANPLDPIIVTPVISDLSITTALQDLKDTLQVCIDPGISLGASPTCENNPSKVIVHSNRILTLPSLAENWTGLVNSATFNVPSDAVIFFQRSVKERYNGVNYLIEYILESPSGQKITAIKRIVVTEASKLVKNSNPIFNDIFADGISMTNLPLNSKVSLTNNLASTEAENYNLKDSTGNLKSLTEQLLVTWFITDGSTKYYRSVVNQLNEYTGPAAAPVARSAYIFAVARDNRGGVAVIKRKLN